MAEQLVLGFDFGTSSVKAALFDAAGRVRAADREPYPLLLPGPGLAEQRPADWWDAMGRLTRRLLQVGGVGPSEVSALGISAQMCGTIPVDRGGEVLHNALIWLDTRSEPIARRITAGFPRVSGYGLGPLLRWLRLTNGAPNLSGKDPTSKILWFREQRPEIWARTHKLLDVKDYLLHRCCGEFVTTEDLAHVSWLMDTRAGHKGWSPRLLATLDLDRALLPDITHAAEPVGRLRTDAAEHLGLAPGTVVVGGAGDVTACALGAGDVGDGATHLHVGTSSWLAAHLPRRAVDVFSGVATLCAAQPERYLLIATQESAGSCVDWACNALGVNPAQFDIEAAESRPGSDGLQFLPWLYGERVPVDDAHLRGGFLNLSLQHGRPELARAVLEGVALNTRWAMGPVDRITGNAASALRFLGGGALSTLWSQVFADVLQRPVLQMERPELGGSRGVAMAAAVAVGWYRDLEQAMAMAQVARQFEPDSVVQTLYQERFERFLDAHKRNRRWFQRANAHLG